MGIDAQGVLKNTSVEDVMSTKFVTIQQEADFSEAQKKFINEQVSHLLVVDTEQILVGILSQKYLYKTQSPRKVINDDIVYQSGIIMDGDSFYDKSALDSYYLDSVMQKNPFTLTTDVFIAEVILAMVSKNLGCIPVVTADKKIKGMVSHSEIVYFMANLLVTGK